MTTTWDLDPISATANTRHRLVPLHRKAGSIDPNIGRASGELASELVVGKTFTPEILTPGLKGREALVEIGRTYNVSPMTIFQLKAQHAAP